MANIILVHDAFQGGWVFSHAARELRRLGHDVFTPSLTGCGDRCHLTSPTGLIETFASDLASVVRYENLTQVVLAGLGYGGFVAALAAAGMRANVRALALIGGAVPEKGRSYAESAGLPCDAPGAGVVAGDLLVPGLEACEGICDDAEAAGFAARLTPFPLAGFTLKSPEGAGVAHYPRVYLRCRGAGGKSGLEAARHAQRLGFTLLEPAWGAKPMISVPSEFAAFLDRLAAGEPLTGALFGLADPSLLQGLRAARHAGLFSGLPA